MGFPGGSDSKESACNAGDQGILGWGRSPNGENGYLLQYTLLEHTMNRGAFCYRCINRPTYKQILPSIVISNLSY